MSKEYSKNILSKLSFLLQKKTLIFITGTKKEKTASVLNYLLENASKNNFLILEGDLNRAENFEFFLKKSSQCLLGITDLENIDEKSAKESVEFIKSCCKDLKLIINYDDSSIRKARQCVKDTCRLCKSKYLVWALMQE